MMILRESLSVVSHRAVLAAEREIETRRGGERCELEWRREFETLEIDNPIGYFCFVLPMLALVF
jgi:hypothetical protein